MKSEKVLAKGMCEKIGFNDSEVHQWVQNSETISKSVGNIKNHREAFVYIEKMLMDYGVEQPIKVIPTGLYLKKFSENIPQETINQLKVKLGIPLNDKVLITVGRTAKEKEKFFWLLKNLLGYLYSKENYIGIELVSV